MPCRVKYEFADFRHLRIHDFVPIVTRFVVILVDTCEVENHRNVVLGEVVVVAAVVETVGIVRRVVGVIQREVGVRVVAGLTDFVKL